MTIDEAKEVIEQDIPCELDADLIEALHMATASLEAVKELKQEVADAIEDGLYVSNSRILDILDKHLQEHIS